MDPEKFFQMMEEIEEVLNKYDMQVGFACNRGIDVPDDLFPVTIDIDCKEES